MSVEVDQLDKVKQAFTEWRSKRPKKAKIPSYLWQMVEPLVREYPPSMITRALGINTTQLKDNVISPKASFVEAIGAQSSDSIQPSQSVNFNAGSSVEFTKPCGSILKIGNIPASMLSDLISTFMG